MSLTASLFGKAKTDSVVAEDPFSTTTDVAPQGLSSSQEVEGKKKEKKAVVKVKGASIKKRSREDGDSEGAEPTTAEAAVEGDAEAISSAFVKTKKVAIDLFKLEPAGVRESRRDKELRELKSREEKSKDEGKKLTAHERLKKKHLSHAVDAHDEEDARTVFVGNLPNDVDKRKVEAFFKDCGEVESSRIRCQILAKTNDGKKRGRAVRVLRKEFDKSESLSATAYILFKERSAVAKAVQKCGMVFMDRHIVVTEESASSKAFDPKTSAFLGNLAYDTSDEMVWRFFADNGITEVRRVRIVRDRDTGMNRGIGYVEFGTPTVLNKAVALRGAEINGREVRICHVQKSKDPALAKLQSSRREARKAVNKSAKKSGPLKRGQTAAQGGEKKERTPKEDMPSWMGTVTNPRKKLARDLRPLIPNNVVLSREQKKKKQAMANQKAGTTTPAHGWDDGN